MKDWKSLWHYQIIGFDSRLAEIGRLRQHLMVLSSIDSDTIRLKLDNRGNLGQMVIGRVQAGPSMDRLVDIPIGDSPLTLEPNMTFWTDPAQLQCPEKEGSPLQPGDILHVVIDFEKIEGVRAFVQTTSNRTWNTEFFWINETGSPTSDAMDFAGVIPAMAGFNKPTAAFGISQVDLLADESVRTIALFGDSITHMSFYYDALFDRLMKTYPGQFVLENAGIGGNRLCYDASKADILGDNYIIFGPAGYGRYPSDVFGDFTPDSIIILEGVNDVSHCWQFGLLDEIPTKELFCGRLAEIAAYTHEKGAKIYFATICPESAFAAEPWYDESEKLRTGINDWIRQQTLADGWFDFDLAIRDHENPRNMQERYGHGDGLHPGVDGGRAMADTIDLKELMR